VLTNQTNTGGGDNVTAYCCVPWLEDGPEKVYTISVPANNNLSVSLSNVVGGDVDVFILNACNPLSCIIGADDAVNLTGLAGGTYYVVVDGYNAGEATYTITFTCFASCHASVCMANLVAGALSTSDRYLDGEWDATSPDTMYWMYYSGAGTTQAILKWNPATCDTFRRVNWTSTDASTCRMFALDPRNGGQYWTGTITNYTTGTGRLHRVSATGAVLNSWTAIAGLPSLRWAGAAFDPDNNHLWVFIRDSSGIGLDRAYELNVSVEASPTVIQGPHFIPNISPYARVSVGGADYAQTVDKILLMSQGTPNDFVTCFTDNTPGYAGPPPGPGLTALTWCPPDSNTLQGFGLAAWDLGGNGLGALVLTNFTDGNPPHPINVYQAPCQLTAPCNPVTNLTIRRNGGSVDLYFYAPQASHYKIYSTTNANNVVVPPGAGWTEEANLNLPAGNASWTDPGGIVAGYKNYVVRANCP
jgi:hypothetical protein